MSHNGTAEVISPDSSDGAREEQQDRYDRSHYGQRIWDDELPEHERYPDTAPVDLDGWRINPCASDLLKPALEP